ncbi:unnamed protein product [Urochloa humidicola]
MAATPRTSATLPASSPREREHICNPTRFAADQGVEDDRTYLRHPQGGEDKPATPTRKGRNRPSCRPGRGVAVCAGEGGGEVEAPAKPKH